MHEWDKYNLLLWLLYILFFHLFTVASLPKDLKKKKERKKERNTTETRSIAFIYKFLKVFHRKIEEKEKWKKWMQNQVR